MRGASPTPDAAARLTQYRLVKLLGWRGYLEIPANIADDFAAIMNEEARQQAEEANRMKGELGNVRRR